MAPATTVKGSAGPSMRPKKKAATTNMVRVAHATSGSLAWSAKRRTTAARKPARTSAHRMIDPSRADHIEAMV
jgi:hypothetical protein